MTIVVGGRRERLIIEAFIDLVEDGLAALGWLATVASRHPVTIVSQEVDATERVEPNLVAVFADDIQGDESELGTNRTEERRTFWVDVYAESAAIGEHLSGDIRDILRGKMPSLGFSRPTVPVFDASLATPSWLFDCDVEDVQKERGHNPANATQRYWWSVTAAIVDTYRDDEAEDWVDTTGGYWNGYE